MCRYTDLTDAEKAQAVDKCLTDLLQVVAEGGIRFNDTLRREAREFEGGTYKALVRAEKAEAERDELVAAVLLWAKTPGDHGGNPYFQDFVHIARLIAGDECACHAASFGSKDS